MLLVEGDNDLHFITNLCQKIDFKPFFKIESCKSIDALFSNLESKLDSNRNYPIGIVVDADGDIEKRKSKITEITKAFFKLNNSDFNESGLVIKPELEQKFGVWIWPNNKEEGILEDLFLQLVKDKDLLLEEAKRVVENLPEIEPIRFKPQHKSKAIVHSWLAWQDNPGSPIGASLQRSTMDLTKPIIQNFISWLKNLYKND